MEKDKILFFRNNGSATEARVLLFNGAINIYDAVTNDFIISFPLKTISFSQEGRSYYFYPTVAREDYLQMTADHHQIESILKEVNHSRDGFFKKLIRERIALFVVIIIALIVGVYLLAITLVPYIGGAIISRDAEISMGKQLKEVMLAEEKLGGGNVDSSRTIKLQSFADRIKLSNTYPIEVTMVNSPIVNAYALPGGQIVVYSGMLKNISSVEELAALLSHEAAHVNRRHSLRSMLRSAADALIVSVIFSDVSAIAATIIGNTQALKSLDYSRAAETEADEYGMKLMLQNNIDVSGMKKLMMVLQKQGDVPENVSFLSSHPLTKKRIKAAEDFIRAHPQTTGVDNNLTLLFEQLKKQR